MYFDALSLAAIKDELSDLLLGGRVQRIVRPSELSIGLEVYAGRRHQLLLSAEPQTAGVYLPEEKSRRGVETHSPLQLLLRKHVRGARLSVLQQPPLERVLCFGFEGEQGRVDLVCEVMGRLSNIILLGADGTVMDAAKRVPASINRYRTILPHRPYVPPPPQAKENPLLLTARLLSDLLGQESDAPLWRRLLDRVSAISPLLAREVLFRAMGDVEPRRAPRLQDCRAMVAAIHELLGQNEEHQWSPCVAYQERHGERVPVAFAAYELTHLVDHEPAASILGAVEVLREARQVLDPYRQVRAQLYDLVADQTSRQKGRLASLRKALVPTAKLEEKQLKGKAILAMAWAIEPGQDVLEVDLVELGLISGKAGGASLRIELDPALTPSENAQKLFREYRKLQAAGSQVPALIEQTKAELDYLHQLHTDVRLAQDRGQLDEVEGALREAGYLRARRKGAKGAASAPIRLRASDGTLVLVGRNSRQNEALTFRLSSPDDTWLHAHGVPGSHVIVKSADCAVSEQTLQFAARLAAYYSGARGETRVQVDFCRRRHVRPIKGGHPGMVRYSHEETRVVEATLPKVRENADGN